MENRHKNGNEMGVATWKQMELCKPRKRVLGNWNNRDAQLDALRDQRMVQYLYFCDEDCGCTCTLQKYE